MNNWFISITLDQSLDTAKVQAEAFEKLDCSSIYQHEGVTEIRWFVENRHDAFVAVTDCVLRLNTIFSKGWFAEANITHIVAMTEAKRIEELMAQEEIDKFLDDPSTGAKRERPVR